MLPNRQLPEKIKIEILMPIKETFDVLEACFFRKSIIKCVAVIGFVAKEFFWCLICRIMSKVERCFLYEVLHCFSISYACSVHKLGLIQEI